MSLWAFFSCIISFYQTAVLSITGDKDPFVIKKALSVWRRSPHLLPCWVSANLKPSTTPLPVVPTAAALYNKNHIKCPLTHWVHLMWPITPWNVKMSTCAVVVGSRLHENKTDIWIHINDKHTHQSNFLKAPLYCVVLFRIQVQTLNAHILKTSNTEHFNQCQKI